MALIAKIYIDECLSPLLAELLRKEGVDAVSAHETNMLQKKDHEHLQFAKQNHRVLVTLDKSDFTHIVQRASDHAGIIVIPRQTTLSEYTALAERIIDKLTVIDTWEQLLVWIS